MDDVTKANVVSNLEQGVRVLAKTTQDLATLQLLTAEVREPFVEVADYFISLLMLIDEEAAKRLIDDVARDTAEYEKLDSPSEN